MTEPGWPDDWADRMAGKSCPMCATLGKGDNDFSVEVFTGDVADVNGYDCRIETTSQDGIVYRGNWGDPVFDGDSAC